MQNFLTFIKEFRIPKKQELRNAKASFSKRKLRMFMASLIVAFVAMIILVARVNSSFMVAVPADGGTLNEGIIGMPTLVNPVLAISDADKDLTALVYSGLMQKMPDGSFIPDLAQSFTVSPDGTIYTFTMRTNATFQDGTPVTANDVIFTIEKIKDSLIKSPRKIGWDGVTAAKKDENTVIFTLNQPYISFLDNTTIGILPMHIWKNVSAQEFGLSILNTAKAIGSGPYQIDSVSKNSEGVPEKYSLERFTKFTLGEPHIKYINIISFANEKDLVRALVTHSIDQASGISPENAKSITDAGLVIHTATLPRIFGVFFNTANNKVLADSAVMSAFDKALDREEIVESVLGGYASVVHNPIPETIMDNDSSDPYKNASLDDARAILDKAGWTLGADGIRTKGGVKTVVETKKVGKKTVTKNVQVNTGPMVKLAFSLTTGDTPELKDSANKIREQLEKLGAQIYIKIYETGPLNQLIRSRDYEALFFGQIINHESDLFSFWHSSQKQDPGLNIALYSNKTVDAILENAQKTLDRNSRITKYKDLVREFNKDIPALLIYSPKYLYATLPTLGNIPLDTLSAPSDRFASIYSWYADTDHIWKVFTYLPPYNKK